MRRILGWLLFVIMLGYAVMQIDAYPGVLKVQWLGYELETSFIVAALFCVFLIIAFAIAVSIMEKILHLPARWKHRKEVGQHREGMNALTNAFIALAVSDLSSASRHTERATHLLGDEPLLDLLGAQISHRRGDQVQTIQKLERLSQHKMTRYVANRALMRLALKGGNTDQALGYAVAISKDNPKNMKAQVARIGVLLRMERWQEAERLIFQSRFKMLFPKSLSDRLYAVTYYLKAQAHKAHGHGSIDTTIHLLQTACKHQAGFVPAVAQAVEMLGDKGQYSPAYKLIRKCWKITPHPQLIDAILLISAHETYEKVHKRIAPLVALKPQHRESFLLLARVAMVHKRWEDARLQIKQALAAGESAEIYFVLAELEQLQNRGKESQQAAAEAIRKASTLPPSDAWTCNHCGYTTPRWEAYCTSCDSFDTVTWGRAHVHNAAENSLLLLG